MKIKIHIEPTEYYDNTKFYFLGGKYINGWGFMSRILTIFNNEKFNMVGPRLCPRFSKRIKKWWD